MGDDERATLNELIEQFAKHPSFRIVTCCDTQIGIYNTRPFSDASSRRFLAIQARHITADDPHGNAANDDPEVHEMLADPASYAPIPDGHRFAFICPVCGASFVQANGAPVRVPKEIA